jgi:hypothetical protein
VQRDPRTGTVTSTDQQRPEPARSDNAQETAFAAAEEDPLAPARGMLLGSAIGAGLWIAVGLAVWLLL